MTDSISLALSNLSSPPVLAFVLGVLAVVLRSNLKLPKSVFDALSIYLLLAIGVKGGVALREASVTDIALPIAVTLALGIIIPVLAFAILRVITPLDRINRGALAAHYGSTSLVTFTAALFFVESSGLVTEGYLVTLLAVMEIPGLIVGLVLARHRAADADWGSLLHEVLTGKSILLLAGGLAIGAVTGQIGYQSIEPFFGALFAGVLTLFLLQLGVQAGQHIREIPQAGWGLLVFAIVFPLAIGSLGALIGAGIGLSVGGAAVFAVLGASASYIAAPAAVQLSLPEANPGFTLTASLGVTFPVNLLLGIPLYLMVASAVAG